VGLSQGMYGVFITQPSSPYLYIQPHLGRGAEEDPF
jgi:hypothetical protein